ncbi:hypothetical protein PQX77_019031 [Marasmius sp. AFHP31]|nr:hypothetical protein PQX77_019031 [Marasmius sp. AFHP31]
MPARQRHKTQKEREQATRNKHKKYYESNKDQIRSKRRERYAKEMTIERKERKAVAEEEKRVFWEVQAQRKYERNTLAELRRLEKNVNQYLSDSGSTYLERIYHEYLAWTQSAVHHSQSSPLKIPYNTFKSMLDAVVKIGDGVLNEHGAGKEWKECQRFTRRVKYLLQCVDDLEMICLEQQNRASSALEEAYLKGKLQFQDGTMGQWLDRSECRVYISDLDKPMSF